MFTRLRTMRQRYLGFVEWGTAAAIRKDWQGRGKKGKGDETRVVETFSQNVNNLIEGHLKNKNQTPNFRDRWLEMGAH